LVTEDGNGTIWRVAYEGEKYTKSDLLKTASPRLAVGR
jgi:hypothetical protein